MAKYLIVGCGLSGSVIGRELADAGHQIKIWDRRDHIGGNMYDYKNEHGIIVHKYGPHCFHTNDKNLYDYMCRFNEWQPYKMICKAEIDGKTTPSPFNFKTIDDFYPEKEAAKIKEALLSEYPNREFVTVLEALESSNDLIRNYAKFLFEKDYSLYTAKQWGMKPSDIDPSVLKRVPLRLSYKDGYFEDKYQMVPINRYEDFFNNILYHPNITIELGVEALDRISIDEKNLKILVEGDDSYQIVYTGALDELFGCRYGKLPYRSLRFEWIYEDRESFQDAPLVAYPQAEGFTRIVEYKKFPVQDVKGTTYAVEYPLHYNADMESEPYYPVLTENSKNLYAQYLDLASAYTNLVMCGRLADFKYYNMDQCLERSLCVAKQIIGV